MAALASITRNNRNYGQQPIDSVVNPQRERHGLDNKANHDSPCAPSLVRQLGLPGVTPSSSGSTRSSTSLLQHLHNKTPQHHNLEAIPRPTHASNCCYAQLPHFDRGYTQVSSGSLLRPSKTMIDVLAPIRPSQAAADGASANLPSTASSSAIGVYGESSPKMLEFFD